MGNKIVFDSLDELKAQLLTLPADLRNEAVEIVNTAADEAKDEITDAYPDVTGHLRGGMAVIHRTTPFGVVDTVINRAPHVFLYENGTQARHYVTVKGKTHLTGQMPAFHAFIPRIIRRRRKMYEELSTMVETHGLKVTGDA